MNKLAIITLKAALFQSAFCIGKTEFDTFTIWMMSSLNWRCRKFSHDGSREIPEKLDETVQIYNPNFKDSQQGEVGDYYMESSFEILVRLLHW